MSAPAQTTPLVNGAVYAIAPQHDASKRVTVKPGPGGEFSKKALIELQPADANINAQKFQVKFCFQVNGCEQQRPDGFITLVPRCAPDFAIDNNGGQRQLHLWPLSPDNPNQRVRIDAGASSGFVRVTCASAKGAQWYIRPQSRDGCVDSGDLSGSSLLTSNFSFILAAEEFLRQCGTGVSPCPALPPRYVFTEEVPKGTLEALLTKYYVECDAIGILSCFLHAALAPNVPLCGWIQKSGILADIAATFERQGKATTTSNYHRTAAVDRFFSNLPTGFKPLSFVHLCSLLLCAQPDTTAKVVKICSCSPAPSPEAYEQGMSLLMAVPGGFPPSVLEALHFKLFGSELVPLFVETVLPDDLPADSCFLGQEATPGPLLPALACFFQQEASKLKKVTAEQRVRVAELTQRIESIVPQLNKANQDNTALTKSVKESGNKNLELEKQLRAGKASFDTLDTYKDSLAAELAAVEAKASHLADIVSQLTLRAHTLEQANADLTSMVESLRQNLALREQTVMQLQHQNKQQHTELVELKNFKASSTKQLNDAEQRGAEADAQLSAFLSKVHSLEATVQQLTENFVAEEKKSAQLASENHFSPAIVGVAAMHERCLRQEGLASLWNQWQHQEMRNRFLGPQNLCSSEFKEREFLILQYVEAHHAISLKESAIEVDEAQETEQHHFMHDSFDVQRQVIMEERAAFCELQSVEFDRREQLARNRCENFYEELNLHQLHRLGAFQLLLHEEALHFDRLSDFCCIVAEECDGFETIEAKEDPKKLKKQLREKENQYKQALEAQRETALRKEIEEELGKKFQVQLEAQRQATEAHHERQLNIVISRLAALEATQRTPGITPRIPEDTTAVALPEGFMENLRVAVLPKRTEERTEEETTTTTTTTHTKRLTQNAGGVEPSDQTSCGGGDFHSFATVVSVTNVDNKTTPSVLSEDTSSDGTKTTAGPESLLRGFGENEQPSQDE